MLILRKKCPNKYDQALIIYEIVNHNLFDMSVYYNQYVSTTKVFGYVAFMETIYQVINFELFLKFMENFFPWCFKN